MERMFDIEKTINDIKEYAELLDKYRALEEENKKLNIKVASLEGEIKGLNSVLDKLKEENQTLELWLDNKEKLNEEYRKEIAEQETEGHGLFDEIEYRKRECKKSKEDVDFFRQCYLDLKKLCEKEGFMLSDEEVTKMFNLDEIK